MRWERAAQQLRREAELREWMRWNMIVPKEIYVFDMS